jgi:PAS domain-containing protein
MEQMADHVNRFIDRLENQAFPVTNGEDIVDPGKVNPRQITMELIESKGFHQAVIESIGIGIIVVDRDARIISANPVALTIVKKSP